MTEKMIKKNITIIKPVLLPSQLILKIESKNFKEGVD